MTIPPLLGQLAARLDRASENPLVVQDPNGTGGLTLVREGYRELKLPGVRVAAARNQLTRLNSTIDAIGAMDMERPAPVQVLVSTSAPVLVLCIDAAENIHAIDTDMVSALVNPEPELAGWLAVLNKWQTVPEMHTLLRTFGHLLVPGAQEKSGSPATFTPSMQDQLLKALSSVRAVKEFAGDIEINAAGLITANGMQNKTSVSFSLPLWWQIKSPVWGEVRLYAIATPKSYTFDFILDLDLDDGAPKLRLRCPGLAVVAAQAVDDAIDHLRKQFAATGAKGKVEPLVLAGSLKTHPYFTAKGLPYASCWQDPRPAQASTTEDGI